MNMATSIRKITRISSQGQNKLFYHLPPTAVPVNVSDFSSAIQALIDPVGSLQEFLSALSESLGNPNCFLTPSGRSALAIILLSLKKRSKGSKVIIPAYTCPTVAQAVLEAGLQPAFCDVSVNTLDMDRLSLMRLLDADVLAIIPTHLYGLAQDISDLVQIGQELDIEIIEDAAQAFGATVRGRMVGTAGDFGFFSLGRGKCIPTGNGGVIIADDHYVPELVQTIKTTLSDGVIRDITSLVKFLGYGLATTPIGWWFIVRSPMNPARDGMELDDLHPIRWNRFSPTQAGIGRSILRRIDRLNDIRRRNAQRLMALLSDFKFVHLPEIPADSKPVFLRLPIILDEKSRADLLHHLLSKIGIGVSRSYFRTVPEIFSSQYAPGPKNFPGAEHLANCLLTLPTHPFLKDDDFHRIQHILTSLNN
jgi:perosamine synthetase